MIETLKSSIGLSDVTISCNGFKSNLHKIVLASSSTYFQNIFQDFRESKHPIVILTEIEADILQLIVKYIYCGFVDVPTEKIDQLILAAKSLQIKVCQLKWSLRHIR